jgi:hypothetical protein
MHNLAVLLPPFFRRRKKFGLLAPLLSRSSRQPDQSDPPQTLMYLVKHAVVPPVTKALIYRRPWAEAFW